MLRIALGLTLAVYVGCGSSVSQKLSPVRGKITVDGGPLTGGTVVFQKMGADPQKAQLINGTVGTDGGYEMSTEGKPGVPPGEYVVTVFSSVAKDSTTPPEWLANQSYSNPQSSGLKLQVVETPAPGAYDLQLKK